MNIDEKETIVLEQGDLVILNRDHTCNIKLSNHGDDSTATIIKVSIFLLIENSVTHIQITFIERPANIKRILITD
ncbi:hypothetical protein RCO48_15740 [Peribacillus frigoritolerans]|nr:hypothetical protein [Peribacillus frigoritolerans]